MMSVSELRKSKVSAAESNDSADPLADLFGFEAAQKRLQDEQNEKTSTHDAVFGFKPWRVFVNNIESYHGRRIVEVLSEQQYVNSLWDTEEGMHAEAGVNDEEEEREGGGGEEKTENENFESSAENEGLEKNKSSKVAEPPRKFEIIGTTKNREYKIPEEVRLIVRTEEHDKAFIKEMMNCGYIIYDISEDESQIKEALRVLQEIVDILDYMEKDKPKAFKNSGEFRHFILISTIMTWALTKPLNLDDPNLPFTEADYRKRKPHPNFKEHIRCEREVMAVKKRSNIAEKLKTVVLCSGITYGYDESPLHYLFKMGWTNQPFLPIFGHGNNIIPLLHVQDLASTVSMLLKNWPNIRYIVAVEQEPCSQKVLIKKLSRALSTGKVKSIANAEAFLLPDVSQRNFDVITTNIRIDPVYIVDHNLQWHYELPFQENMDAIVKEYKIYRNLVPIKVVVLGPPASGKTRLAQRLADHYGIHYVNIKQLIVETIQRLSSEIEASKRNETELGDEEETSELEDDGEYKAEEENDEGDEVTRVDDLQQQLDEIRNNLSKNNDRLSDDVLNKLLLNRLLSKACQNQGYVLDGYPKTLEQTEMLFGQSEEDNKEYVEDEEDENDHVEKGRREIMPDLVISLEACDEFLKERVINLPEREVQWTHYTEEHMLRRLREYRDRNTDENTPLQFFDELEIHPFFISIEDDVCPEMFPSFYKCLQKLGVPRKYDPTLDEIEENKKREEAFEVYSAAEEARKRQEILKKKEDREGKMLEWTELLQKLKQEEDEQLCILAEPLRNYLMKYVFPTLTQGLIELAKLRPNDPVDYLAEYLFKENPEGKMFEPDYTETMSTLLDSVEELKNNILSKESIEEHDGKYSKEKQLIGKNMCVIEEALNSDGYEGMSASSSEKTWDTEKGDRLPISYYCDGSYAEDQ